MSVNDRRLIEDYIPIEKLTAAATSEAPISHGHISSLHVWYARRPLVECRAAVYATLVPAPTSARERREAGKFVVDLCQWRTHTSVFQKAAQRIRSACGGAQPKVLDCFAGGGAIPLEALRLGCEAHAVELNPVAHLIELCTLVYPQLYGRQVLDETERWARWVMERAWEGIGDLYQPLALGESPGRGGEQLTLGGKATSAAPGSLTPVAYIWTRTAVCPNPTCQADVPLLRQAWLCKKPKRRVALRQVIDPAARRVRFEVAEDSDIGFDAGAGSRGSSATCPFCQGVLPAKYVRDQGEQRRLGLAPMAVVCTRDGEDGKVYAAADAAPEAWPDDTAIRGRIEALLRDSDLTVPDEVIPPTGNAGLATGKSFLYGMETFGELHTPRQLLALLTLCRWIRQAYSKMVTEGLGPDLAAAVSTYLGLWLSRVAERGSSISRWNNVGEKIEGVSALGRFAMMWDFPECNPFGGASGSAESALETMLNAAASCVNTGEPAVVRRASVLQLPYPDATFDAVVTDPPYYDSQSYSERADYYYVWLKRAIASVHPEHFATHLTSGKKDEVVAAAYRHGGDAAAARHAYEQMLLKSFEECHRVLKPGAPLVVVYAHKTTAGWATLVDALRSAGFAVSEAWPVGSEMEARIGHQEDAKLASNIFIAARRREGEAVGDYATDVRPQLQAIVRERVQTLMEEGVTGADLVIAAVGAGLRAYTQYARVELPNGEELDAKAYLDEVQREVLETVLCQVMACDRQGVSGVDKPTQYYVLFRYEYGEAPVDFDEANVLARGVGVELDAPGGLTEGAHALAKKDKSTIALRTYRERGEHEQLGLAATGDGSPALVDVLHRLLWLLDHESHAVPDFLTQAQPDVTQLRLVAQALAGRALAAEPTPGQMLDQRTAEQHAIDRLLAAWRRIVEENLFVR